jgi:hypothetical protein
MKRILILFSLLAAFLAGQAQVKETNDIVRGNSLQPWRVANALDMFKPVTASGTDTYTFSISVGTPTYTPYNGGALTYQSGDVWTVTFTNANTGAATLNINSEGAIAIVDNAGNALSAGDIEAGGTYKLRYNGTHFRVIGQIGALKKVLTANTTVTQGTYSLDLGTAAGTGTEKMNSGNSYVNVHTGGVEINGVDAADEVEIKSANYSKLSGGADASYVSALGTGSLNLNSTLATSIASGTDVTVNATGDVRIGSDHLQTIFIDGDGTGGTDDVTLNVATLKAPGLPSATTSDVLYYNTSTGAITQGTAPAGGGFTLNQKTVSTTTYTVVNGDNGYVINLSNASGCTVTLPASLSTNTYVAFRRLSGSGTTTFVASGGAVLNSYSSGTTLELVGPTASWMKRDATNFDGDGALGPAFAVSGPGGTTNFLYYNTTTGAINYASGLDITGDSGNGYAYINPSVTHGLTANLYADNGTGTEATFDLSSNSVAITQSVTGGNNSGISVNGTRAEMGSTSSAGTSHVFVEPTNMSFYNYDNLIKLGTIGHTSVTGSEGFEAFGASANVNIELKAKGTGTLKLSALPNDNALTRIMVYDNTTGLVKYRDASSISGGGGLTSASTSTAGGTIDLDMASLAQKMFNGSASFATAKAVTISNTTGSLSWAFNFEVTNLAATLTFPANVIMQDVQWNTTTQVWTPPTTGKYTASAWYDGTDWRVNISGAYQ